VAEDLRPVAGPAVAVDDHLLERTGRTRERLADPQQIVGVLVGTIGIDALWSGALAGALALGVMKLTRMPHSPAAATAMIAVVPAIPRWEFVVLIGSAAAILVAVGLVGNKINRAKYPHYWW